jgi:hypothetical protein
VYTAGADDLPLSSVILEISPDKGSRPTSWDVDDAPPLQLSVGVARAEEVRTLAVESLRGVLNQLDAGQSAVSRLLLNANRDLVWRRYDRVQADVLEQNVDGGEDVQNMDEIQGQLVAARRKSTALQEDLRVQRKQLRGLRAKVDELESERSLFVSETEVVALQSELEASYLQLTNARTTVESLVKENGLLREEAQAAAKLRELVSALSQENKVLALSVSTGRDNLEFFREKHTAEQNRLQEEIISLRNKLQR